MTLENSKQGIDERINPLTTPRGILSVHQVRYEFASAYCLSRRTLDVACGAGYGAEVLGRRAQLVVGGDVDADAVEFAAENYVRPNLKLTRLDALVMPFGNASFERIVSFETIEHLADIEAFLTEVARVLTRNGVFIVSTPLVPVTNRRPKNPHHTIEFSLSDFGVLLANYFASVELFGQSRRQSSTHRRMQELDIFGLRHRIPSLLRKSAARALETVPFEDMGTEDQRITRGDFVNAHDMIAVCGGPKR